MAGGSGARWGNYMGIPKHLVPIDGVPLLHRTVAQFLDRHVEVVVLAPPDPRYQVNRAWTVRPEFTDCDTDKFLSSMPWWHYSAPTTVVYGDCYLTDLAVDALTRGRGMTWVGRAGASNITGCPWGELFGVTVDASHHGKLASAILQVRGQLLAERIPRGGGWEVYRATQGMGLLPDHHAIRGDFVEVDDWSDDFDFPEDYDRWNGRRALLSG
jgi:hypothetical protein